MYIALPTLSLRFTLVTSPAIISRILYYHKHLFSTHGWYKSLMRRKHDDLKILFDFPRENAIAIKRLAEIMYIDTVVVSGADPYGLSVAPHLKASAIPTLVPICRFVAVAKISARQIAQHAIRVA